jgi:hypothetical protein
MTTFPLEELAVTASIRDGKQETNKRKRKWVHKKTKTKMKDRGRIVINVLESLSIHLMFCIQWSIV